MQLILRSSLSIEVPIDVEGKKTEHQQRKKQKRHQRSPILVLLCQLVLVIDVWHCGNLVYFGLQVALMNIFVYHY